MIAIGSLGERESLDRFEDMDEDAGRAMLHSDISASIAAVTRASC